MAGRLVAKALIDGFTCEVDFTKFFLKQILGQPLYINDLEDIDPQMVKGLMDIFQNSIEGLQLYFTYTINQFGEQKVIELIPNRSNIEVTEENKKDYVKKLVYFRMVKQIETQVQAFQKSFYEVIPLQNIKMISVRELDHRLSGNHIIDINDMKQNLIFKNGYNQDSDQIKWFFEILEEYDQEQRAAFLFFTTGCFKVPFGGFQNFRITINKSNSDKLSLPVSHTCFKELGIQKYIFFYDFLFQSHINIRIKRL
ncbi:ubiquitin- hect domain protein, putative [Ichthyophthirius multifiliis]|uniref:HECT-type E3 ubiquitin transferase n=1 Tax=Ichthyophthirius multifiliis TaxID=5932 RepID=G0QSN8_ICHMU|nr:ubiquitin- hect domain protein, putative [Ichthyophthirius multifiliis]EGR31754.1 ubiquitin- hect domain protein, putative [Ichthyophthirius multifiliis]|eukprot:XP_004035240.1 ubiquitin- hect domain protein, putative [Ichthyophthirius multifiliis]